MAVLKTDLFTEIILERSSFSVSGQDIVYTSGFRKHWLADQKGPLWYLIPDYVTCNVCSVDHLDLIL